MSAEETFAPLVFRDYSQAQLDAAYDQNVWCADRLGAWKRRAEWSAEVAERLGSAQYAAYGPNEIEKLDIYSPLKPDCPVLIFLHGGAWQRGTAAEHAFAAETILDAGVLYIVPDFSNVQDVGGDLGILVEQARASITWAFHNVRRYGGDPHRIYLTGHSSGAHLASVALITDWASRGIPSDVIRGALLVSGLYDLQGARLSARSKYVTFTDHVEEAFSAARFADRIPCPVTLAYASSDSPEFQRMAQEFALKLSSQSKLTELIVGNGYDHFTLLETLGRSDGLLAKACVRMMSPP